MTNSYKREIIALVQQMKEDIGEEALSGLFDGSERVTSTRNIGCNQFREFAMECADAECYEEIVLQIQYSQAKSKPSESWKTRCANGKAFGTVVTDYMERVKALCGEEADWETLRVQIRQFFTYLYFQSRIWADSYRRKDQKTPHRQFRRGY